VCKSGVREEEVIPIYGRGGSGRGRTSAPNNNNIASSSSAEEAARDSNEDSVPTGGNDDEVLVERGQSGLRRRSPWVDGAVSDENDTNTANTADDDTTIPQRPSGQRSEASPNPNFTPNNPFGFGPGGLFGGGGFTMGGAEVSLFPLPFFGISWGAGRRNQQQHAMGEPMAPVDEQTEHQRQFLKRLLLFLALIVILCIFNM